MANTAGVSNSFKSEVLMGYHQLGAATLVSRTSLTAPTTDVVRAALYLSTATVGPTKATYGGTVGSVADTGEATGTGYTAGGIVVTNANPPTTQTSTGTWTPSASLVYTTVSIGPVDCALIFNNTQLNKAIEVCTFTAQTPVAATLTLTMPVGGAGTSLLNLA
jgi:hypothetical protein